MILALDDSIKAKYRNPMHEVPKYNGKIKKMNLLAMKQGGLLVQECIEFIKASFQQDFVQESILVVRIKRLQWFGWLEQAKLPNIGTN